MNASVKSGTIIDLAVEREHGSGSEYLMINSFEIKNFRCFKDLKLGGLKRFNVIVGESGSGKTALLEALFLAGGINPEIYFRTRHWRGFGESIALSGTRDSYESLFRDMFYGLDQKNGIVIRFSDSNSGDRALRIFYRGEDEYSLPLRGQSDNVFAVSPIVFQWRSPGGKTVDARVVVSEGKLSVGGAGGDVYPIVMVSPVTVSAQLNALKFSDLSKKRAEGPVVAALKAAFPQVESISLESIVGELMLYVAVDYLEEKLPVAVLSAGINKYLSILIAIAAHPGGVILVDEIENGLYYKALTPLLASIFSMCEKHNCQLIMATHSYELLQAMIPAMEDREEAFTLLKAARLGRKSVVTAAQGRSFRAAIEESVEVR